MVKQVVVIAGPSGSGKNSLINAILKTHKNCVRLVTATTRQPRPGEKNGVDYYFFTPEEFDRHMSEGHIPEHRYVQELNTYYGTYLPDLDKHIKAGHIVFAQVDIEGAKLLKEKYNATTIFIMPESLEQFKGRLRVRNPEWDEKEFNARLKITETEMRQHAPQYDYRVINADGALPETTAQVIDILKKEGYVL